MIKLFLLLIPFSLYSQFATKTQVEQCISLSSGKLIVPDDASITISLTCATPPCTAIPEGFSCIYYKYNGEILETDTAKKSAYDAQKASLDATALVYQESQLYSNIQNYCLYTTGLDCPAMPPATFNATANSFSYLTGKNVAEIKKLMKKKIKK